MVSRLLRLIWTSNAAHARKLHTICNKKQTISISTPHASTVFVKHQRSSNNLWNTT